ncbi:MAG: zinc-ribbon domain-containing protein [Deltaproteobacteria bacterium]|uniref:Zinc-ribbon domain-containing protein n=1 Tax=Candidatus Zymogenus saltonus TaxID=2844893 RepID=A0A9D8PNC2_9DELT|nr:zinc-ribbon domain-containing protein [Candidatus Zymogenus saltonus]
MKVRCPNCDASGSVYDGLVPEGGCWLRCPVCRERFFVEKEAPDPEAAAEGKGEGRGLTYYPTYYPTYDPTYHLTDGSDPENEEDLFLYWWFFGF